MWVDNQTYSAAFSGDVRASQTKNRTTNAMEMINGASTRADCQPFVVPDVTAKMKRRRAATKKPIGQLSTHTRMVLEE